MAEVFAIWVGAEGYEWRMVHVGPGDERIQEPLSIELQRSSELTVIVPLDLPGRAGRICLLLESAGDRLQGSIVATAALSSSQSQVTWKGVPSGEYLLRVGRAIGRRAIESGAVVQPDQVQWTNCTNVLLTRDSNDRVTIVEPLEWPGGPTGAVLKLRAVAGLETSSGPQEITLLIERVSPRGHCSQPGLVFSPTHLRGFAVEEETQIWPISHLAPGDYAYGFPELGLSGSFTVVAEEPTFVELEAPQAWPVVVHVRDRRDADLPAGGVVTWKRVHSTTRESVGRTFLADSRSGAWSFRAAEGAVAVEYSVDGLTYGRSMMTVGDGPMEVLLEVDAAAPRAVDLILSDGDRPAYASLDWFAGVKVQVGSGDLTGCGLRIEPGSASYGGTFARSRATLLVPGEGSVSLRFPPIPGFDQPAPIRVDVGPGSAVEVSLSLTRSD